MSSTEIDNDRTTKHSPTMKGVDVPSPMQQKSQGQVQGKVLQENRSAPRANGLKFVLPTVVGLMFSVPLGWLLSHAAQLPFYLGLFFFPLFGLVIGAAMYRAAQRSRPYHSMPLIVGTTVVVLFCWLFSLMVESRDMPVWVAANASRNPRLKLQGQSIDAYRASVVVNMSQHLRQKYPPGGLLGYARWAATDGEITKDVAPGLMRTIHAPQRGVSWMVRVVLSVGLLAFGIGSQTLILRSPA